MSEVPLYRMAPPPPSVPSPNPLHHRDGKEDRPRAMGV